MSNTLTLHGVRTIQAESWDAISASSLDLEIETSNGPLTLRMFCRWPGAALAYAAAINSVSRPASSYDPELDGVACALEATRSAA